MATQTARLGTVALVVGAIAFGLALVHSWAGPFKPEPKIEDVVAEKAGKIREALVATLNGEEPPPAHQAMDIDRVTAIATVVAAFLAIVLGIFAFVRREDARAAVSAVALGGVALLIQYAALP